MNADQVIEGIGKAVASATPAQEYCLFWSDYWWWMCMTKSEWSGWAQAFGALTALAVAFWVAGAHERLEKRDAVVQARAFAKQMVVCIQGMAYGKDAKTWGTFVISIETLQELISYAQTVRSERLPAKAMNALLELRLISVAVLKVSRAFEKQPTPENSIDFETLMTYYAGHVASHAQVLHSKHNGVAEERFSSKEIAAEFINAATNLQKHAAYTPSKGG